MLLTWSELRNFLGRRYVVSLGRSLRSDTSVSPRIDLELYIVYIRIYRLLSKLLGIIEITLVVTTDLRDQQRAMLYL